MSAVEQIFEWWYFKKYGTSFIEQFTITYLSPLLGGAEPSTPDSDELVPAAPELTVPGIVDHLHDVYSLGVDLFLVFGRDHSQFLDCDCDYIDNIYLL